MLHCTENLGFTAWLFTFGASEGWMLGIVVRAIRRDSATPLGAPQNLGSNSELQPAVLLEMKLLQPEHHNTKAMEILISSVLTFLQAISATPYLYLLFFFYLLIGKAWKIFVFIHPEEMHIRITCAEVGNNHVEIGDQPHTPI